MTTATSQRCAINAQHWNIRTRLNLVEILPFMNQNCILTDDELYRLQDTSHPHGERIDFLIRILPNKGDNWWNKFLWCLTESSTHPGLSAHEELANLLIEELHKQQATSKVENHFRLLKYSYSIVNLFKYFSGRFHRNAYGATLVVAFLFVMFNYKGTYSRSTVIVNISKEAAESRPLTTVMVDGDTSDEEPTNALPLVKSAVTNPTSIALTERDGADTTNDTNVTDNPLTNKKLSSDSVTESNPGSERFANDHPTLPQGNQTALSISDYINLLFNLSHVKPDDDLDSVQVMQKHLNLTQCLIYQIENEKMVYALFDLWKVYLALHNIWFPTKFEKYLITAIEGVTHWSYQDLTLNNHIKEGLVKATNDLITMKIVLAVTNVTLMNMIQKVLKITDLVEQLTAGVKVKTVIAGIQQAINSTRPAYHEGADFHARHIYNPALERYLTSVIFAMNARDVCFNVFASL